MENPASICILRLSALGDATHVVPLIRTLQKAWPEVAITWVINRLEAKLVAGLPGVTLLAVDKSNVWRAYADLKKRLDNRRFDVLLQCQLSLRANFLSGCIKAKRRIGYDRPRSKELHGLFINERIPETQPQHVLDAIGSFAEALGLKQTEVVWDIPVPEEDRDAAEKLLPGDQPTLIISPCSSHPLRNWRPEYYAEIGNHAILQHGLRVALCGGRTKTEKDMAQAIAARMGDQALDLVGKDTLKQFLALAKKAKAVLSPDSGPMHMANAVGTAVLGLHAATDSRRSGPYSSLEWCVDRYAEAARKFMRREPNKLAWGRKIEYPGVMDLISPHDVREKLDGLMAVLNTSRPADNPDKTFLRPRSSPEPG